MSRIITLLICAALGWKAHEWHMDKLSEVRSEVLAPTPSRNGLQANEARPALYQGDFDVYHIVIREQESLNPELDWRNIEMVKYRPWDGPQKLQGARCDNDGRCENICTSKSSALEAYYNDCFLWSEATQEVKLDLQMAWYIIHAPEHAVTKLQPFPEDCQENPSLCLVMTGNIFVHSTEDARLPPPSRWQHNGFLLDDDSPEGNFSYEAIPSCHDTMSCPLSWDK